MKLFKTIVLLCITFGLFGQDPCDPFFATGPVNGSVSPNPATAADFTLTSDNNGGFNSSTQVCFTAPNDGLLSFDWHYESFDRDGPAFDPFVYSGPSGFVINTFPRVHSGSVVDDALVAGQTVCWDQIATDGILGPGVTTISNFDFVCCTLELSLSDADIAYFGYGPASCISLSATASGVQGGGVSYSWTANGEAIDGDETADICAEEAGCILVVVTATDDAGCVAVATQIVPVVDVTCQANNGKQKVEVCHSPNGNNPHTICISSNAVQAHLDHGDQLGACGEVPDCDSGLEDEFNDIVDKIRSDNEIRVLSRNKIPSVQAKLNKLATVSRINVYPNPAQDIVQIYLNSSYSGTASLSIFSQSGQIVKTQTNTFTEGGFIELNISELSTGSYQIHLDLEGSIIIRDLMVW